MVGNTLRSTCGSWKFTSVWKENIENKNLNKFQPVSDFNISSVKIEFLKITSFLF